MVDLYVVLFPDFFFRLSRLEQLKKKSYNAANLSMNFCLYQHNNLELNWDNCYEHENTSKSASWTLLDKS